MTKEGLKRRVSEGIIKLGRGLSCVQPQALPDQDRNCDPEGLIANTKEIAATEQQPDCLREDEVKEMLETFEPQRICRSISFTGFGVHDVQRVRRIAEGCCSNEDPGSVVTEQRNRCHSFAGVKNKKLVKITRGSHETTVIDGLLTTTFCSTEL